MSSSSPHESDGRDEAEDLDRLVHDLRDQIDGLRARVSIARQVLTGEDDPSRSESAGG
jgi:hypothetical protein